MQGLGDNVSHSDCCLSPLAKPNTFYLKILHLAQLREGMVQSGIRRAWASDLKHLRLLWQMQGQEALGPSEAQMCVNKRTDS